MIMAKKIDSCKFKKLFPNFRSYYQSHLNSVAEGKTGKRTLKELKAEYALGKEGLKIWAFPGRTDHL